MMQIWKNIKNAVNELLGVEAFATDISGTTSVNIRALGYLAPIYFIYMFTVIALLIAISFGAARQSYCYNIFIGNSESTAIGFSILCFFFAQFYYPFYAIFLNPLCNLKVKNNRGILGGLLGGKR